MTRATMTYDVQTAGVKVSFLVVDEAMSLEVCNTGDFEGIDKTDPGVCRFPQTPANLRRLANMLNAMADLPDRMSPREERTHDKIKETQTNVQKMERALILASKESMTGHDVMILVPDKSWMGGRAMTSELSDVYGALYTRCTTVHSGLKLVAIDTLILVEPDDPAWDAKGEALARERLRTSMDPKVIKVGEKA